jgi:transposase-like protein
VSKLRHGHTVGYHQIEESPVSDEIISHAVRLYFRFCLSFRDVEELLERFALE